jgi:hypothetical protein
MKINVLFYLLVAIFFAVSCNNNTENNKTAENTNETKTDKKDPFSKYTEIKLPLKLEAPTYENAVTLLKNKGLDILTMDNPNPKKTFFRAGDGTPVEIACSSGMQGGVELILTVMMEEGYKIGEEKTIPYLIYYAGQNYNSASGKSEISIEGNTIKVITTGESTAPAPNTDMDDPEIITKSLNETKIFKITPKNIIEE